MHELLDDLEAPSKKELFLEGNKIDSVTYKELVLDERKPITAIDGGSAVLLQTANNCLLFVRIIAATMTTRKTIKKTEGYVLAVNKEQKITVTFYPLVGPKEKLFTIEETLLAAANLGRKMLEWQAVDAAEGIVAWDGSLTPTNDVEAKYLPKHEKLIGVSKTTGTLGNWKVFSESPEKPWKAHAFGTVWFAKLHEKAKHYFRVDAQDSALIDVLLPWSCDPSFLGYPYPLILVDQLARVSNEEAGIQKIQLQTTAGKKWDALAEGSAASDAHEILDSLQF